MKIGILTHHYISNYGAFLQAYALQKAVEELFPDAEVQIIDYVNIRHFVVNTGGWFRFYRDREDLKCWLRKIRIPAVFSQARRREMHLSPRCRSSRQVNALNFDCIIVGSDEVWNYRDRKGNDPIKFGRGLTCPNLIAYAPSTGQTEADERVPDYVAEGIRGFRAVSARDDLTAELVEKITGSQPLRVLDPTFLKDIPRAKSPVAGKPYILFYYCDGLPKEIRRQIFDEAEKAGLAVYGAGECDKRYSRMTVDLTPFEWVEMFRGAEFVLTGTFHGAVFSILNRKPFKVYLTNKSRIKKVDALLRELEIENRNITPGFCLDLAQMRKEIDYDRVYRIIGRRRKESLDFLRESIEASDPERQTDGEYHSVS